MENFAFVVSVWDKDDLVIVSASLAPSCVS